MREETNHHTRIRKYHQPKLTLVGAGPGDPDLITVKGINALIEADVVLYDALVNIELLKYVRKGVPQLYVGKRKSNAAYTQEQINHLIVDLSFTYGHVVRLKGGDPFVFGRGQEEINYATSFNIPTTYIPGISSAISVAGLSGIPVTHRGSNESFWVITATTRTGQLSNNIQQAAQTNATAVILMGLSKLPEIIEIYRAAGKSNTAIAIIQNGSLPTEHILLGTIETITKVAENNSIGSPAVIVIGEVVKQHPEFLQHSTKWSHLGAQ